MLSLSAAFMEVKPKKFVNCEEGYLLRTPRCEAIIAITEQEIIMSHIYSHKTGGGRDMLDKLEQYAKESQKDFLVSNIISPRLRKMVEKRGYSKEYVPFAPEHGMMDLVEVYRYNNKTHTEL